MQENFKSSNGSMCIIPLSGMRSKGMGTVPGGDVFVYVGSNSKMVGEAFRDACEIELLSGIELRRKTKGASDV